MHNIMLLSHVQKVNNQAFAILPMTAETGANVKKGSLLINID